MKKALICLLMVIAITSCTIKFGGDDYLYYSSKGGLWAYPVAAFEGSTLSITDGKETAKGEFRTDVGAEADSIWIAEISWAYATYRPSKKTLFLTTEVNETGAERSCTVSAIIGDDVKRFHLIQKKDP